MRIQIYLKLLKIGLSLLFICGSGRVYGFDKDTLYLPKPTPKPFLNKSFNKSLYNPRFIEDYTWNVNMRLVALVKRNHFQFRRSRFRPGVDYATNESAHLGLAANWQWLGLALYLKLPETEEEVREKGNTQGFDLSLNVYGRKFGMDANFQQYTGYYLQAITSVDTVLNANGRYPQREDIITSTLFANFHYVLNHERFSFRATFNQSERQKQTAGSFILNPFFSYYSIQSDSAIVPSVFQRIYPNELELSEGKFYSLGLSMGYGFTLVKRNFFFSAFLFPGLNLQLQNYETLSSSYTNRIAVGTKVQSRLITGINGKRAFVAIQAYGDTTLFNLRVTELRNRVGNVRIAVGYRFGSWRPY